MRNYKTFIKSIQSQGIYVFSKEEALKEIETNENSLKVTLARNIKLGNLIYLGQHLYSVIPPGYGGMGAPPPEWYIDTLMKAHRCHYYVGLLTAASYHGAVHQAPKVFQVICNKRILNTSIGKYHIRFFYSKPIFDLPQERRNTPTGCMNMSTPEVTAFDLIKYMKQSGSINHVSTILSALGENIKAQRLKNAATHYPPAYGQRLGYMLDKLGYLDKTATLNRFIREAARGYTLLRSDGPDGDFPKCEKWHVIINEVLNPDT